MSEPTSDQRKMFAKMGLAMPDGSYYIRNGPMGTSDLQNAIDAVGRSNDSHDDVRMHIMTRAKALHMSNKIPADWNPDGSLKHEDTAVAEFILHHGIKGMKWGSRKGGASGSSSSDHVRTAELQSKVRGAGGTHALSNEELQHLTQRLNLERNYRQLTEPGKSNVERGRSFARTGVNDAKMAIDAIETGRKAYKLISELTKNG
jgi:hypothetical protein